MCLDQGVGIIPYFPLAGGILTGKYNGQAGIPSGSRADTDPSFNRFLLEHNVRLGEQVSEKAAEYGCSPCSVARLAAGSSSRFDRYRRGHTYRAAGA